MSAAAKTTLAGERPEEEGGTVGSPNGERRAQKPSGRCAHATGLLWWMGRVARLTGSHTVPWTPGETSAGRGAAGRGVDWPRTVALPLRTASKQLSGLSPPSKCLLRWNGRALSTMRITNRCVKAPKSGRRRVGERCENLTDQLPTWLFRAGKTGGLSPLALGATYCSCPSPLPCRCPNRCVKQAAAPGGR